MPTQSYLTLGLFNSKYGIAANLVREIFPLPELRSIPEMPGDVIGVLDLRGTIIPVMHLAKRLGLPLQECSLSDSVVV
ncbi:MAG: chemotaxis protein CheW, partial [Cyanobacteria bacterium P01_A01_bin.3]